MAEPANPAVRLTLFLTFIHIAAWATHFISYAAVPARSVLGTHHALAYSALYVLICSASALFAVRLWQEKWTSESLHASGDFVRMVGHPALVGIFCALSVAGLGFHYYDKLIINHFSGSCLADFRGAWITATITRGRTLSSWQSALGHTLSHAAFPLLFVLFVSGNQLSRRLRIIGWWVAVSSVLLYAVIIGTRTTILSFVACAVIAAGVSIGLEEREAARRQARRVLNALAAVLAMALVYAVTTSADRMYCHGGPDIYVDQFVPELSAELAGKMPESDMGKLATLIGLYLSHSAWTFEKSLESPHRSGYVFLNFGWYWLFRLGLIDVMPSGERPYKHGMMSLTGAAWYDFDLLGMLLVAVLHGILIAVAARLLVAKDFPQVVGALVYVCIGLITAWAPLAFAPNTLSYPFIGLAFLMYFACSWGVVSAARLSESYLMLPSRRKGSRTIEADYSISR